MTDDDDRVDLGEVAADDAALDRVRAGARLGDDEALLLLRGLVDDVDADVLPPVPVGCGSTVLRIAGESSVERRRARNGALVAAIAAGVLSLSGVAAASTVVPADSPLAGLGQIVRSAAGAVVGAVTPPDSIPARPVVTLPSPAASAARAAVAARPSAAPGAEVSAAARSRAAVRQVTALLDAAQQLLADDRPAVAAARLDTAERRLADVLPAEAEPLAARLAQLRSEVEAATAGPPAGRSGPAQEPAGPKTGAKTGPEPDQAPEQGPKPDRATRADQPKRDAPSREPRAGKVESPTVESPKAGSRGRSARDASTTPRP